MAKIPTIAFALACLFFTLHSTRSAPGEIDPAFDAASDINRDVNLIAPLPDGRFFIAGSFTSVRGGVRNHVARLLPQGTIDPSFDMGIVTDDSISNIHAFADGSCLISGGFREIQGQPINGLAALLPDGTINNAFVPELPAASFIHAIHIQPDGKILLGGQFAEGLGQKFSRVIRLLNTGALDSSFTQTFETDGYASSIALQSDGKILIAGTFSSVGTSNCFNIARLNTNGALDTSFDLATGARGGSISKIVVQPDQKILLGGSFNRIGETTSSPVGRLLPSGARDTSFNPNVSGQTVFDLFLEDSGSIVIAGSIGKVDNINAQGLARLNSNGSLAGQPFVREPFFTISGRYYCVAKHGDAILAGGIFTAYPYIGSPEYVPDHLLQWKNDGTLDSSFQSNPGPDYGVDQLFPLENGRTLVSGHFKTFNGVTTRPLVRLNADGSLDPTFSATNVTEALRTVSPLRDGKILTAIQSRFVNGVRIQGVTRLNPNGSVDPTFTPRPVDFTIFDVKAFYELPDGDVLMGGNTTSNMVAIIKVRKDNGQRITTFNPPQVSVYGEVLKIAAQKDGKIIVTGGFRFPATQKETIILRLQSDGALDPTFPIPTIPTYESVGSIKILEDDKILLGGWFPSFGAGYESLVRLKPIGEIDPTFVNTRYTGGVARFDLQQNGKIVTAGRAPGKFGGYYLHIGRLSATGAPDDSFTEVTFYPDDRDAIVNSLAVQSDGKILLGGFFRSINDRGINHITRLLGDPVPTIQSRNSPAGVVLEWQPVEATLLASPTVDGQYESVFGATTPWTVPPDSAAQQFYKVTSP